MRLFMFFIGQTWSHGKFHTSRRTLVEPTDSLKSELLLHLDAAEASGPKTYSKAFIAKAITPSETVARR